MKPAVNPMVMLSNISFIRKWLHMPITQEFNILCITGEQLSQIEIDFVLGDHEVAIEVKSTANAVNMPKDYQSFAEEYTVKKLILVTNDPFPRQMGKVLVLPWQLFLQRLWAGEIIN